MLISLQCSPVWSAAMPCPILGTQLDTQWIMMDVVMNGGTHSLAHTLNTPCGLRRVCVGHIYLSGQRILSAFISERDDGGSMGCSMSVWRAHTLSLDCWLGVFALTRPPPRTTKLWKWPRKRGRGRRNEVLSALATHYNAKVALAENLRGWDKGLEVL